MENTENTQNKVTMNPIDAIVYCQNKLGSIPYTVKESITIGAPLAEVITLLDQLKSVMIVTPITDQPKKAKVSKKKEG